MIHMAAAYSTAMLYTRHNDPADRDDRTAKRWLNSAIATASLVADPSERAFQSAFYKNGLALVEVNLGEPSEALRLVNDCISSLDRGLGPDEHRLHRSVLKNNRARVYASLGHARRSAWRTTPWSSPRTPIMPSTTWNGATSFDAWAVSTRPLPTTRRRSACLPRSRRSTTTGPTCEPSTGDIEGALADFSYVIELEPDFVDAYANRAGLYLETGDLERAGADATAGLARDGDNPYLLAVAGQVHAARQEYAEARAAYDRALESAPDLVAAWSGRAELACDAW